MSSSKHESNATDSNVSVQAPVVCLEFFSGIGGLHYGFQESGIKGTIAMSFDMNEIANTVYEHNFKLKPNNKAIDYLIPRDIERYKANCWLMSPPCQPYTRGGKYLDDEDPRARGLIHLLKLLPKLETKPKYLFLENVMNFENSRSRKLLVETLGSLGFEIYECLVSPIQFGIPNNRLRYFLSARLKWPCLANTGIYNVDRPIKSAAEWQKENDIRTAKYLERKLEVIYNEWPFGPATEMLSKAQIHQTPLERYIDPEMDSSQELYVPEAVILKRKNLEFDIVRPADQQTSTFTKAYGSKHLIGAGSLLQTRNLDVVENGFGHPEKLLDLGLRFFSPKEVALLHHFPYRIATEHIEKEGYYYLEFPPTITTKQQLKLLGNSLNVKVVAELLKNVLFA